MNASEVFYHAIFYIALIVISGIATLGFFIVFIVKLSQDNSKKWNWLGAVAIALVALIFTVFLFMQKVVSTVKNIESAVEGKVEDSFKEIMKQDSSYKYTYLESNSTVLKLKEFETLNNFDNVPKEFYVYYGFRDYYRMPLTYPFSIHCVDVLENGTLYKEEKVIDFNVNDNGEEAIELNAINSFAFDNNVLITKTKGLTPQTKDEYFVYEFATEKKQSCNSLKEAFHVARKQFNYSGYDTLITLIEYNNLFN